MTIKIEKNIPVDDMAGRGRKKRWPFDSMDVGDSIPVDDEKQLKAARNAAYLYRKRHPEWDYETVKYKDGSGRLWRRKPV